MSSIQRSILTRPLLKRNKYRRAAIASSALNVIFHLRIKFEKAALPAHPRSERSGLPQGGLYSKILTARMNQQQHRLHNREGLITSTLVSSDTLERKRRERNDL